MGVGLKYYESFFFASSDEAGEFIIVIFRNQACSV